MGKIEIKYDDLLNEVGARLKNFIMSKGLSQFKESALSRVTKGNGGMSFDLVHKLLANFDIDFNWLIKGENTLRTEIQPLGEPETSYISIRHKTDLLEKEVESLKEQLKLKDEIISLLKEKTK